FILLWLARAAVELHGEDTRRGYARRNDWVIRIERMGRTLTDDCKRTFVAPRPISGVDSPRCPLSSDRNDLSSVSCGLTRPRNDLHSVRRELRSVIGSSDHASASSEFGI